MRKQVTFVEGYKEQHLIWEDNSRFLATRSAGHYCIHRRKNIASDTLSSDEKCGINAQRTVPFKPNPKPTSEIQQLTTIHIPKSMMAAPFLQNSI
ncbi:protein FAM216A isoform X2 [Brienomyrus brachyistius]|uniref:protein FAM216A isoform X2 n=1 Tax=Brienomyrus brachyistius TaxID=42636 RepID=UPI0020B26B97|nr:protein FAM216A isoform X2 [Brienomyrus brachyistius]